MRNEEDGTMETTETKAEPGSGAVQVNDDAYTDSGTSPPLAEKASIHDAEPGRTKVAAPNSGDGETSAHLAHDQMCAPPDDPQTSDDDEALRELSSEDPELAEEARRFIAGFRDFDRARESGGTDIARLEAKRYPNRKTGEPVITAKWDDALLRVEPITSKNARKILNAQATDPKNGHYLVRQ